MEIKRGRLGVWLWQKRIHCTCFEFGLLHWIAVLLGKGLMFVDPNYIESDCIGWDAKFLAAPSRRQLVNQSQTMTHDILHISKDPCSFLLSFQQHFFCHAVTKQKQQHLNRWDSNWKCILLVNDCTSPLLSEWGTVNSLNVNLQTLNT